jgi:DNA-binding NarL/FixJ family response regulator
MLASSAERQRSDMASGGMANALESRAPLRVAIVEDDLAARNMLVATLQADADYTVVAEFAEGRAAVSATHPGCDVLVVTTFGDERTITSALEAGADGYLLKGAPLEEMRRDIHSLRAGGSPLSPMVARQLLNRLQAKPADDKAVDADNGRLTRREHEILVMITKGFSYAETSQICGIAAATVHSHLKSIYRKLEVHSKTEAVYEARRRSLI